MVKKIWLPNSMVKKIRLPNSNGVLKRQIDVDDSTGTLKVYDENDNEVMDVENHGARHDIGGVDEIPGLASHGSRHGYGGADAIPNEALRFAQLDKVFGTESAVSVGAGATSTISKGVYYVTCGANTKVEYSPDGGSTWRTLIGTGGAGLVISDGSNVRLNNGGVAAEDSYLLPIE